MTARRCLYLAVLAFLPGCVADEGVARLLQSQEQERPDAIAAAPVPAECRSTPFKSGACAGIHERRAHACLELARRETAPKAACPSLGSPSARRWLQCAVDSYAMAPPPEQAQSADLRRNRARAFYCGARLQAMEGASATRGAALASRAASELSALPPSPADAQLAASAELFIAQEARLPADERCASARRAALLASRGLGAITPATENLVGPLLAAKSAALREAGAIEGCG